MEDMFIKMPEIISKFGKQFRNEELYYQKYADGLKLYLSFLDKIINKVHEVDDIIKLLRKQYNINISSILMGHYYFDNILRICHSKKYKVEKKDIFDYEIKLAITDFIILILMRTTLDYYIKVHSFNDFAYKYRYYQVETERLLKNIFNFKYYKYTNIRDLRDNIVIEFAMKYAKENPRFEIDVRHEVYGNFTIWDLIDETDIYFDAFYEYIENHVELETIGMIYQYAIHENETTLWKKVQSCQYLLYDIIKLLNLINDTNIMYHVEKMHKLANICIGFNHMNGSMLIDAASEMLERIEKIFGDIELLDLYMIEDYDYFVKYDYIDKISNRNKIDIYKLFNRYETEIFIVPYNQIDFLDALSGKEFDIFFIEFLKHYKKKEYKLLVK